VYDLWWQQEPEQYPVCYNAGSEMPWYVRRPVGFTEKGLLIWAEALAGGDPHRRDL